MLVPPSPAAAGGFGAVRAFTELDAVADELLQPSGTISKGQAGSVDGQPAIAPKVSDGRAWVATTGSPYLPRVVQPTTSSNAGTPELADDNAPMSATAPAGALDAGTLPTG